MKRQKLNIIASLITKIEGGKSQIRIGDSRELVSRLVALEADWKLKTKNRNGSPLDLLADAADAEVESRKLKAQYSFYKTKKKR